MQLQMFQTGIIIDVGWRYVNTWLALLVKSKQPFWGQFVTCKGIYLLGNLKPDGKFYCCGEKTCMF